MFDTSQQPDHAAELRCELATVERVQARCTEATATSEDRIPMLVERLRMTEAKRRALTAQLDRVATTASRPAWRDIERRMRARLKDWRTVLTGDDVADTRQGIRELLTTAIKFTPFVDARGFEAIRFEDVGGLEAVSGGEVASMASPRGCARVGAPETFIEGRRAA